mmetsp:Transcript_1788/g.4175  ORF Transcript_1788/g.4175 Transcript_1788/m.4175 type:complete len:99 (+) Transcript_1788:163-459(+)
MLGGTRRRRGTAPRGACPLLLPLLLLLVLLLLPLLSLVLLLLVGVSMPVLVRLLLLLLLLALLPLLFLHQPRPFGSSVTLYPDLLVFSWLLVSWFLPK